MYQFQLPEYFLEVNKFFFFYASFTFIKNVFVVEFSLYYLFSGFFPLPSIALKNSVLAWLTGRKLGIVTILRDLEQVVVLDMGEYFYSMI